SSPHPTQERVSSRARGNDQNVSFFIASYLVFGVRWNASLLFSSPLRFVLRVGGRAFKPDEECGREKQPGDYIGRGVE
ncbi:MAG: hypothetical protein JW797_19645, partial [Bradymonadales bacterium]|nr:hypothetical protein [Bradymonadales bacterium]